jgi:cytochrome b561
MRSCSRGVGQNGPVWELHLAKFTHLMLYVLVHVMAVLGSRVVSRSDRLSLRRDSVAGSCGQGHTLGAYSWRRSRLSRYLLLAFNLLRVAGALYHYLEARTACCSECYRASSGKRRNVWAQSASWLRVNLAPMTSYRLLKYFSS